jgi:3-hydroxymyristoyl/3-hydroxydecanoyl-(acyl carrier protein) dehydratase
MTYSTTIPALPYVAILRQYAAAHGMRLLTIKDIERVQQHYIFHASQWN